MSGYIKLHRKLLDWELYKDTNAKTVFIHLLLKAKFKPTMENGVLLQPGQVMTSLRHISAETGLSLREVRTTHSKLVKCGNVTQKTTHRGTLVTIVNWASYQCLVDDATQSATQQRHTEPLKATHSYKEEGEERKKEYIVPTSVVDLWNEICESRPKVSRLNEQRKKKIQAREKEDGAEGFKKVFQLVEASDFLSGRNGRWQGCNFDWVLTASNWTKIIEGNYNPELREAPRKKEAVETETPASEEDRKKVQEILRGITSNGKNKRK